MKKYNVIPEVDETEEVVEIGRYFFSIEKARASQDCRCDKRIKKGEKRLHIGGYNNVNSGNVCMECAKKLAELIKNG